MPKKAKKREFSPDFIVLAIIKMADDKGIQASFTYIVEEAKKYGVTRTQVSMADDRLDDLCLIKKGYEKVGKSFMMVFHVDPIAESMATKIANRFKRKKRSKRQ